MNNCRRYWSAHSRISLVADQIPINQWEKIKSNLHFVDNSEGNTGDRLFKVKPVIEKFNCVEMTIDKKNFAASTKLPFHTREKNQSIDNIIQKSQKNGDASYI